MIPTSNTQTLSPTLLIYITTPGKEMLASCQERPWCSLTMRGTSPRRKQSLLGRGVADCLVVLKVLCLYLHVHCEKRQEHHHPLMESLMVVPFYQFNPAFRTHSKSSSLKSLWLYSDRNKKIRHLFGKLTFVWRIWLLKHENSFSIYFGKRHSDCGRKNCAILPFPQ